MHQANDGAKVSKNVSPKKHVATAPLKRHHMPFLLQKSAYKIQRIPLTILVMGIGYVGIYEDK